MAGFLFLLGGLDWHLSDLRHGGLSIGARFLALAGILGGRRREEPKRLERLSRTYLNCLRFGRPGSLPARTSRNSLRKVPSSDTCCSASPDEMNSRTGCVVAVLRSSCQRHRPVGAQGSG
jgi:hypothetical protein